MCKKKIFTVLASLMTTIMLLMGYCSIPSSAAVYYKNAFPTFSGFTEFPENLTFQQVKEMSPEEFLSLPNAQAIYDQVYSLLTTPRCISYYITQEDPFEAFSIILDNDAIVDSVGVLNENGTVVYDEQPLTNDIKLAEPYDTAYKKYYESSIQLNTVLNNGDYDIFTIFDSTGLSTHFYRSNYRKEFLNNTVISEYEGSSGYRSFYLGNPPVLYQEITPIGEEKVPNTNYIKYLYDQEKIQESILYKAKSLYGYFYVFEDTVHFVEIQGLSGGSSAPISSIVGDINVDGKVTIIDAVQLKKAIAGKLLYSSPTNYFDIYKDNMLNDQDFECLMRYLIGLEESLPVIPET